LEPNNSQHKDVWASGEAYEPFIGRWSRLVAREFLAWLAIPPGARWLDVGCGTGALTHTILQEAAPAAVRGVDASETFIAFARTQISDPRATFQTGDAQDLPVEAASYDAVVSGLMLNFVPRPQQAAAEMRRATRPGGVAAVYVWDYANRMQFMRHFWNAAAALDPDAVELDEGRRFPINDPSPLEKMFRETGLKNVEVQPIDTWMVFKDFDDFWSPFLRGQGPAPAYVMRLSEETRSALRDRLHASLPIAVDGSIPLMARAWAVRGVR